jgi:beta-lactamase class A
VEVRYEVGEQESGKVGEYRLIDELRERVATASGSYAVYVYELDRGEGWGFNEREVMPGASILKIPAMLAALKRIDNGQWTMGREFELLEADRATGSGPLQFVTAGTKISLERLIFELGKKSDNTAWLMLNRLLGVREIEDVILNMGMLDTKYREGTTTAVDVAKLLAKVYEGEVLSRQSRERVWEYLTDSIYEDRIPIGITGEGVSIVHKVGTLADVWSDAGIIECKGVRAGECKWGPFVVVILNKGVKRVEAEGLVPWITGRVWEYEKGRK